MKHGANQLGTWIEGERNPWLDVYTPEQIVNLARLLKMKDEKAITLLGHVLGRLAEKFLFYKNVVELDLTPTNKVDWINANLRVPAQKIIDALNYSNDRLFCDTYESNAREFLDSSESWLVCQEHKLVPVRGNKVLFVETLSERDTYHGPLRTRLVRDLKQLISWVDNKNDSLQKKRKRKWNRTRHKEELVFTLLKIYICFLPRVKHEAPGQGPKLNVSPSMTKGAFAIFVRQAAAPILGGPDNLSDQMKKMIARYKNLEKTGRFDPTIFPLI